jgi:hypothetical protein
VAPPLHSGASGSLPSGPASHEALNDGVTVKALGRAAGCPRAPWSCVIQSKQLGEADCLRVRGLLMPQRFDWFDSGGAPCGQIGSHDSRGDQKD